MLAPCSRILITGAAGFVGQHLLPCLTKAFPAASIVSAGFNVVDERALESAIRAHPPDACVHLAAVSAVPAARADPDQAWRVNLQGTLLLARALLRWAPQAVLLFVSTADAYGASFRGGAPVTETTVLAPMNTYAATKAAADLALGAMAEEGLRVVRMRPFNHTGPGQSESFVVASFARQVARIEAGLQAPVIEVGALDARRDFLDVRDVCRAYALALHHAAMLPPACVLNIASGTSRQVGDVLDDLMRFAGVTADIRTNAARLRPSDIAVACADASRAKSLIGWRPEVAWEQTLRDTLTYWRKHSASVARA